MKILVVGSGGREHALAWKIAQSPHCEKLYCAPGNPGTSALGENVPLADTDVKGLLAFALEQKIDLTVVGPEVPLAIGIVDEFEKAELRIFGPRKKAAELEGSKIFAKQFMERHRIPTGRFRVVDSIDQAQKILRSGELGFPIVLKADGLAAGKGVVVCPNIRKAEETASDMMVQKKFGSAGKRVLIEEFLRGREVSFIVISDGARVLPLATAMDHKAVYDGDKGPNTGGMGAISPSPHMNEKLYTTIMDDIIFPTVTRMLEEGRKYKGVLYAGIMLTEDGPKVLEYNCRFGDPETQPQMLRLESDLVEILLASIDEDILKHEVRWSRNPSACVVLASGGYPLKYEKGKVIKGLDEAAAIPGVRLFHAGTSYADGDYLTGGGRVLDVCATGETLEAAMKKIYEAVGRIYFEAMHFRRDIGAVKEIGQ
ncbi:MAG: phosphoribosylamine--glycine ligase [Candidatus Aminicenantales bacterium]